MTSFWLNLLLLLLTIVPASAQDQSPITASLLSATGWRPEFMMVAAFLLLGLAVVVMQFILFYRAREHIAAGDITRSFVMTLVVIAVVALVGLGYSAEQIQPAIALFGTIIGYFVGRGTRGATTVPPRDQNRPAPPHETPSGSHG